MGDVNYGQVQDDAELDEVALLLNKSFGRAGEIEMSRDWAGEHGLDALRRVRVDGSVAACAVRLPMGHWFGGRSVPTLGIAGVGVAPERRGQGIAKRMMQDVLREARDEGFALSSLYASTFGLYRHVGYERAGQRNRIEVDPQLLVRMESDATVRPLTEDDEPAARRLYDGVARLGSGMLDRSEDIWRRVSNPIRKPAHAVLIEEDGVPTGYARWVQVESKGTLPYDVVVSDHVATTPAAARRLMTLLADHGTLAERVRWFGGPGDPLLALLDTIRYEQTNSADWLLRFVDVPRALEARGYAPGVAAEVHLDVEDELFEENAGRFVLRVADGRGSVERGGDGRVACTVRALAPLYTGHVSAAQLRAIGWLTGDDASCASTSAAFAGPVPSMPDHF